MSTTSTVMHKLNKLEKASGYTHPSEHGKNGLTVHKAIEASPKKISIAYHDEHTGSHGVAHFIHDGKKGDWGTGSEHGNKETALDKLHSMKEDTQMDEIKDMIDQLVDGNTEQAEQAFNAAIGVKVIDALDSLKVDVAHNLYK